MECDECNKLGRACPEHLIRIPILGSFACGKTSLRWCYMQNDGYEDMGAFTIDTGSIAETNSFEYAMYSQTYTIQLIDTMGNEKYGRVTDRVLTCDGCVFVASYDNPNSLDNLATEKAKVSFTAQVRGKTVTRKPPYIMVCMKSDLPDPEEDQEEDPDNPTKQFTPTQFVETCSAFQDPQKVGVFDEVNVMTDEGKDVMNDMFEKIIQAAISTHREWYLEEHPAPK
ncbi:hypothetical protein EIN_412170 [Entamoeba invadens IP1]|uniref:Uncharacterized protein n=1 Tax=Entamoeba invadens IP1 TaxID=370355 RepID=A0A0A1UFF9_ENTIV|nr:hypothetical protein EIN_412170 [Entamoeba invadens IP1]ELP95358.1 hypothetical protein EIN_412170 [Entamoeba invadens IP1]|eukprot:XP_004262129.1 hypothetical protein EIN_412170 [Entamoeba invadens IP1]